MAYRKILVPIVGTARESFFKTAFDTAAAFGAHVTGFCVHPDPTVGLVYLGEGLSASVIKEILDAARDDAARGADLASNTWRAVATAAKVPLLPAVRPPDGASASFEIHEGDVEELVAEEASVSDLTLFETPKAAEGVDPRLLIEATLFRAGKPVLVMPSAAPNPLGKKAVVAWNGDPAAARAVSAAIPFLKRASSVEILIVEEGNSDLNLLNRLRDYLRVHGVATVSHACTRGGQETGAALIDAAEKSGAGLLIMGGYGHSRMREMVLGGVTRYVLAHPRLPTFMVH